MELSLIPLQHMWVEMDCVSKQGLTVDVFQHTEHCIASVKLWTKMHQYCVVSTYD
jgi:hypothetical protein